MIYRIGEKGAWVSGEEIMAQKQGKDRKFFKRRNKTKHFENYRKGAAGFVD
jgi:hypothetical protein